MHKQKRPRKRRKASRVQNRDRQSEPTMAARIRWQLTGPDRVITVEYLKRELRGYARQLKYESEFDALSELYWKLMRGADHCKDTDIAAMCFKPVPWPELVFFSRKILKHARIDIVQRAKREPHFEYLDTDGPSSFNYASIEGADFSVEANSDIESLDEVREVLENENGWRRINGGMKMRRHYLAILRGHQKWQCNAFLAKRWKVSQTTVERWRKELHAEIRRRLASQRRASAGR